MNSGVVSVTDVRNALRCPRAFVLGRREGRSLVFPLSSSSMGATFHRVVDRFSRSASAPPPTLGSRSVKDPAARTELRRWLMDFLIRELQSDPSYGDLPQEVDELAEAMRAFGDHVAERLKAFPGTIQEALAAFFLASERPLEAAFPEVGIKLMGRLDALFQRADGELEIIEYKLTDEANAHLDESQVMLYREMMRRSEGIEAQPVILRFTPQLQSAAIPISHADARIREDLIPFLGRMGQWLARPETAPPARLSSLCAVCPVRRSCEEHYPASLGFRDDPPACATRPRPTLTGGLAIESPRTEPSAIEVDLDGHAEAQRIQDFILKELKQEGIAAKRHEPVVGPTLYCVPVSVPKGPVARLDKAVVDIQHRLYDQMGLKTGYHNDHYGRQFMVQRPHPRPVLLKDLLAARKAWLQEKAGRFVVGQQPDGQVLVADLSDAATPHLLVAGQSGSGKSWLLRSIVASLIHFHAPAELKLTLLDPKRVSFTDAPFKTAVEAHLDRPVLCELDEALPCFESFVDLMESRYSLFQKVGVDNLHEYNLSEDSRSRLPRQVILMDEYENLVADKKAAKPFNLALQRLGSKGRGAGVHLILSTQHPDRKTVDANIQCNLAGKIALKVAKDVDSRIILDAQGAEKLFGNGDLLASLGRGIVRAQGPVLGMR